MLTIKFKLVRVTVCGRASIRLRAATETVKPHGGTCGGEHGGELGTCSHMLRMPQMPKEGCFTGLFCLFHIRVHDVLSKSGGKLVCATGTREDSSDVEQNLRTYVRIKSRCRFNCHVVVPLSHALSRQRKLLMFGKQFGGQVRPLP
jgi:hypothetical protein